MEFVVFVIIAFVFATGGAFRAGAKTAFSRAARRQAKSDLVSEAVTADKGGRLAHKAGTKAGGVTISGLGLIRRAFTQGWRQSWGNGKKTSMKWFSDAGYKVGSPVDRRNTDGTAPADHGQVEGIPGTGRYTVRWGNGEVQTVKASKLRVCVGHDATVSAPKDSPPAGAPASPTTPTPPAAPASTPPAPAAAGSTSPPPPARPPTKYTVGSLVDRASPRGGFDLSADHGKVQRIPQPGQYTVLWGIGDVETVTEAELQACGGHDTPPPVLPATGSAIPPTAGWPNRCAYVFDYHPANPAGTGRCHLSATSGGTYCSYHQPHTESTSSSDKKGPEMAIETANHGEVQNISQLLSELDAIVAEAAAELEDAAGDRKRAEQDMRRIEMLVISAQKFELDTTSLTLLQSLIEPAKERANLADRRAPAAERQHGTATKTRDTINAKHSALQDAHDAAGTDAATKAAYART